LSQFPNSDIIDLLTVENLIANKADLQGGITRFTLEDVKSLTLEKQKDVKSEILRVGTFELPRINPRWHFKKHNFAYGLGNIFQANSSIIKIDVTTKESKEWTQEDCYPAESLFIPNPEGKEEDDGILMSIVLDTKAQKTFLLILDAKTMTEIGRAVVPQVVPFGFHGNFFGKEGVEDSFY